ncbi:hypothetical protein Bbelb_193210 [Branchiostoma belcheri]|nr:hypothetical protein Bbelb_193210 [Branchiostoma belcheri]
MKLNYMFVKIHKAGSTTTSCILQRFGYEHNLTFVLPMNGKADVGWPNLFKREDVIPSEDVRRIKPYRPDPIRSTHEEVGHPSYKIAVRKSWYLTIVLEVPTRESGTESLRSRGSTRSMMESQVEGEKSERRGALQWCMDTIRRLTTR